MADSTALGAALTSVQDANNLALTSIQTETTQRVSNHAALASVVDTLAAGVGTNAAAIITEQTVRAGAIDALAEQIDTIIATGAGSANKTYLQSTAPSAGMVIGDVWYDSDDNKRMYRYGSGGWVDVTDDRLGANVAAIVAEQTARINADTATTNTLNTALSSISTNTAAISTEATTRASADTALASSITSAQTTLNGSIAAAETRLDASIATVDGKVTGIGARYTAKLSVNGLVGGFGVYNNGTEIDAGFDVNTFWIGKDNPNKRKPFILVGDETFIDQAIINQLTFTKLRDATGAVMVENGRIKSDYISTRGLSVTDAAGNVILAAGSAINMANFGNSFVNPPSNIANSSISLGGLGYSGDLNATANQSDATTNAAISARLAKSGADTLTGPISLNAATAILVGNTSDGLYLGNAGIVGRKAGATTFSVAADGTATFAGALSAATGSFAGSLSAASGTFAGTLTAAAINAVDTINIAGNAVTTAAYASGNGFSRYWGGFYSGAVTDAFSTISFSANAGDVVLLEATWKTQGNTTPGYGAATTDASPITAQLAINGSTIAAQYVGTLGQLLASSIEPNEFKTIRWVSTIASTGTQTLTLNGHITIVPDYGGGGAGSYAFREITLSAFIRRR